MDRDFGHDNTAVPVADAPAGSARMARPAAVAEDTVTWRARWLGTHIDGGGGPPWLAVTGNVAKGGGCTCGGVVGLAINPREGSVSKIFR